MCSPKVLLHLFLLLRFRHALLAWRAEKKRLHRKLATCGGVCGRVVDTSNSGSGGPGFKPRPPRCFLRQGTLLHFVSLHPGV